MIETKKELEQKMFKIQEMLDGINYKIDIFDQKSEPSTDELITPWKVRNKEK